MSLIPWYTRKKDWECTGICYMLLYKDKLKSSQKGSVLSLRVCNWMLFSCSVMSISLWPYGLQHTRFPCPGVCSNSCSLSRWSHPTVSSSAIPFSSCLQSFPESGSFPMSWLFALAGQSIEASASVLPMNIQDWFPLGLTGLISLLSQGLSKNLL